MDQHLFSPEKPGPLGQTCPALRELKTMAKPSSSVKLEYWINGMME
jgi:hypothetical protein